MGEGRYMNIRHNLPDLGFIPTLSQTQLLSNNPWYTTLAKLMKKENEEGKGKKGKEKGVGTIGLPFASLSFFL